MRLIYISSLQPPFCLILDKKDLPISEALSVNKTVIEATVPSSLHFSEDEVQGTT